MIYKVSYVVTGKPNLGGIVNVDSPPHVGDQVELGGKLLEVTEVIELIPPREDFAYLHVTCQPVNE
jgi:hypothetical protein